MKNAEKGLIKGIHTSKALDLDIALAFAGIVISLAVIVLFRLSSVNPVFWLTGVLTFFFLVAWLLIRKNFGHFELFRPSRSFSLLLNFLFLLLLLLSFLLLDLRSDPYVRPLSFFVLMAAMICVVAFEVLVGPLNRGSIVAIISKIITIGAYLQFSEATLFPSVVGVDPWWHQKFTSDLMILGHIPSGTSYSDFPAFHLLVASVSLSSSTGYKFSAMISAGLVQVILNCVIAYLLGRYLFSKRAGLLAGLFLVVSSRQLSMGLWSIPNTLAGVLIPFIIYLLLRLLPQRRSIRKLPIFLLAFALILTHIVSSVAMSVVLLVSVILYYSLRDTASKMRPITFPFLALFCIIMMGWWLHVSGDITSLAWRIRWGFSADQFSSTASTEQIGSGVPFQELIVDSMSSLFFFTPSLVGCFYAISKRSINRNLYVFVMAGLVLLVLPYISLLTGRYILEGRWWYYAQMILALPLSIAVLGFIGSLKSGVVRAVLFGFVVTLVCFAMMISPVSNIDNNELTPHTTVRAALTESELQSIYEIRSLFDLDVGTDYYYSQAIGFLGIQTTDISAELYKESFREHPDEIVLIRNVLSSESIYLFSATPSRLGYDPNEVLGITAYQRVFDSGSVSGYMWSS